jgi:hypothetical protein
MYPQEVAPNVWHIHLGTRNFVKRVGTKVCFTVLLGNDCDKDVPI